MIDIIPRQSGTSRIRSKSTGLNVLHTVDGFVSAIAGKTTV